MKSFAHTIGSIFQPVFHLFGWILAFFYGLIPNYAIAIALLTIVIMGALTPFTIKSTKSMMSMQKLQPEIKKLQQKYKGAENRQLLNEELMRLYKEEGANPVGGCLPVLLQAPFLFILYSVIKGLSNQVLVHGVRVAQPRYISWYRVAPSRPSEWTSTSSSLALTVHSSLKFRSSFSSRRPWDCSISRWLR
jgi:YidC/Oxa1 family membrane protein insertase